MNYLGGEEAKDGDLVIKFDGEKGEEEVLGIVAVIFPTEKSNGALIAIARRAKGGSWTRLQPKTWEIVTLQLCRKLDVPRLDQQGNE